MDGSGNQVEQNEPDSERQIYVLPNMCIINKDEKQIEGSYCSIRGREDGEGNVTKVLM